MPCNNQNRGTCWGNRYRSIQNHKGPNGLYEKAPDDTRIVGQTWRATRPCSKVLLSLLRQKTSAKEMRQCIRWRSEWAHLTHVIQLVTPWMVSFERHGWRTWVTSLLQPSTGQLSYKLLMGYEPESLIKLEFPDVQHSVPKEVRSLLELVLKQEVLGWQVEKGHHKLKLSLPW